MTYPEKSLRTAISKLFRVRKITQMFVVVVGLKFKKRKSFVLLKMKIVVEIFHLIGQKIHYFFYVK